MSNYQQEILDNILKKYQDILGIYPIMNDYYQVIECAKFHIEGIMDRDGESLEWWKEVKSILEKM